ncbi:hypothetical protein ACU4GD_25790 [Cupriavidus basilensis]
MEEVDRDNTVRVVVLTGAGRGFCAGMDIDELEILPPGDIRAARMDAAVRHEPPPGLPDTLRLLPCQCASR